MRFFTSSFSCFFLAKPTKIAVQFQYCNSFNHIIFVYQNQKGAPIHCGIAISMWSIMPLPPSRTHHRPTTIFLFHITIFFYSLHCTFDLLLSSFSLFWCTLVSMWPQKKNYLFFLLQQQYPTNIMFCMTWLTTEAGHQLAERAHATTDEQTEKKITKK